MVYDCFQFFNEIDILKLRMNILNDIVDKFVIVESTVTFSGNEKKLNFAENRGEFREFENKIIYVVVDDTPNGSTFERDKFQKNAVIRGIKNCKPDDVIIYSDVDEIPNPEVLAKLLSGTLQEGKIYHLAQRMFYCYLNYEEFTGKLLSVTGEFPGIKKGKWLGTKVCFYSMLNEKTMSELRDPSSKEEGIRIENGGWHWGYLGERVDSDFAERVGYKIKSAAHTEFAHDEIIRKLRKNIVWGKDIFGRKVGFKYSKIDDTYPELIRENLEMYKNWILPKEKFFKRVLRIWLTYLRLTKYWFIKRYYKVRKKIKGILFRDSMYTIDDK